MRALPLFFVAAGAIAFSAAAVAQQAHTTRIETRPYYGAVVSIEHGVRVTRPLPPTEHMIINPNGATPIVIGGNGAVSVGSPEAPAEPEQGQEKEQGSE